MANGKWQMANGKEQSAEGAKICKDAGIGSATQCVVREGVCGMTHVRMVSTNLRGVPVGDSSPNTRSPDRMDAEARALRAQGLTIDEITARLNGPHHSSVWRWVTGLTRKPPARIIATKRVKVKSTPECLQKAGVHPTLAFENHSPSSGTPSVTPFNRKRDDLSDLA